jgi:CelD/BcsL family acetyltransferase involved in cellulose biosynthesis
MTPASSTVVSNEANVPVVPRRERRDGLPKFSNGATSTHAGEILEINRLDALEPYAADWNKLLNETPGASYFHSYDWFAAYWRHLGADQRMRILLVLDSGRLTGVVPLVVVRERTKLGTLRSLRYPLHGWGSFYGPIGRRPRESLHRAITHVLASRRDWDLLDMLWVDRDGADQGATAGAATDAELTMRASPWLASARIELCGGWDRYWASRKSHFRTNVRRDERRLRAAGEVTFIRHRPLGAAHGDGDPRWELYDECERLAAQSWQGGSTSGTTLSHESVRAYLRAAHASASAFGGVDLNLLLLAGRPVAFAYNYHFAGYVYGLRAGFDASAAPPGAGTALQSMMIEDSCRRGDLVIDLGPGSLDAKRAWQTRLAIAWRYTHYSARSPRAQILRALHAISRHRVCTPSCP